MDYYFFSYLACIAKIKGKVYQLSTDLVKIDCSFGDVIEFCSPQNKFLPLHYILGENSPLVKEFATPYGVYVFPEYFTPYPYNYEKIFCQNYFFDSVNITVIADGFVKLLMQNESSFNIEQLPFKPTKIECPFAENGFIGLLFMGERSIFYLYDAKSNSIILRENGDISFNKTLTITKNYPTLLKHEITKSYNKDFTEKDVVILRKANGDFTNPILFKYAFLECISLQDNVSDFLLHKENKDKIYEFFGNFNLILPFHEKEYDFILIYSDSVKFVKIKLNNNLIEDIILD